MGPHPHLFLLLLLFLFYVVILSRFMWARFPSPSRLAAYGKRVSGTLGWGVYTDLGQCPCCFRPGPHLTPLQRGFSQARRSPPPYDVKDDEDSSAEKDNTGVRFFV